MKRIFKNLLFLCLVVSTIFSSQYINEITGGNNFANAAEIDENAQTETTSDIQNSIQLTGKAEQNKEISEEFEITSDQKQLVLIKIQIEDEKCAYPKDDTVKYIILDNSKNENDSTDNSFLTGSSFVCTPILEKGKHIISMKFNYDINYSIDISFLRTIEDKNTDNLIYYHKGEMKKKYLEFEIKQKKKVKISVSLYDVVPQFIEVCHHKALKYTSKMFFGQMWEYNLYYKYMLERNGTCYHRLDGDYLKTYSSTMVLDEGTYVINFPEVLNNVDIVVEDISTYATDVEFANGRSLTLLEDSQTKLKYSVLPTNTTNKKLIWKSSDNEIAKVITNGSQYFSIKGRKPGKCEISSILKNGTEIVVNVVVKGRNPILNYTKKSLFLGETVKLKLAYAKSTVKYSSSNNNIATVTKNGMVKAKNDGKCTIRIKCGNKKYYCKITVKKTDPNFYACLYDYNTRNNYFTVKFKNVSKIPITIKQGIKVKDVNYTSFDRNVHMGNSVTIKPGKTKYIRFYVNGSTTWPDYSDFTLYYKFVFAHKEYEGHVWDENSVYNKGNSWYRTYWGDNEDGYDSWL